MPSSQREQLAAEYFVGGLTDSSLVYDLLTKKPSSVEQALDLVHLHQWCRSIQKRQKVGRQLTTQQFSGEQEESSIRRVNGKTVSTEERLSQFGHGLKTEFGLELKTAETKIVRNKRESMKSSRSENAPKKSWKENLKCYKCHECGHYKRDCPKKGLKTTKNQVPLDSQKMGDFN